MNISFSFPAALLLLLAVPFYPWARRRFALAMPLPRASRPELADPGGRWTAPLPDVLRVAALVLLVLAISGPTTAGAVIEERTEGIPIVLAIDVSSSMLAQDFRPRDRLGVAKTTIANFVEGRDGDPIGLVAFAAEALTLVPTTANHTVLLSALENLEVGLLEDGTAIGDGLATAVNRLRVPGGASGVIVLLSDGESNRGTIDPLAAADAAAEVGVRVFTVGVGSEGVAPVPVGTAPEGFRYAELPVGLDEDLLREIASRAGGAYFRAADPAALERIYAEIDRLVPSVVESTTRVEPVNWAALLLVLAAAGVVVEWGIRGSRWGALP